jgi:autotransporter-associated beta strand protein
MARSWWRRWLTRPSRPAPRRPGPALRVEALEDRLTPAVHTWTGGDEGNFWSGSTNWLNASPPTAGESNVVLNFGDPAARQKTNIDDIAGLSVQQINFTDTGYTLNASLGTSLTLTDGITDTSANSGNTVQPVNTISISLTLNATVTVNVADPARDLVLSGNLGGAGGLTKVGAGALDLNPSGGNSYQGTTSALAGVLNLDGSNAVPGPLVIGDGVGGPNADQVFIRTFQGTAPDIPVVITPSGELVLGDGSTSPAFDAIGSLDMTGGEVLGTPAFSSLPASQLILGGDVTTHPSATPARIDADLSLGGATRTFNVADGSADPDLIITGVISDSANSESMPGLPAPPPSGITKAGAGTLQLTGDNTYPGTTTVAAGTLLVNGSQPGSAVVVSGGTLGGHGTVGSTTVSSGAISPEETDTGTPARLTVSGDFALGGGGTFLARIAGDAPATGYSQLRVTGTVSLAGPLVMAGSIPANDRTLFTLIDHTGPGPVQGTFPGFAEGNLVPVAGVCVGVTYVGGDGNDVVLHAASDDELFVRGVYHGLGLPRDLTKIAAYVQELQTGRATRPEVATAIWNSPAHRQLELTGFYQAFGEPTNDGQFNKFLRKLLKGTPEGTVLIELLTSKPFLRRHRNRTANALLLLEVLTGKVPSKKDVRRARAALAVGGARALTLLLSSPGVYRAALDSQLTAFLGSSRKATAADLAFFLNKLATGELPPLDLMLDIVTGSPTSTPSTPTNLAQEFLTYLRSICASL